LLTAIREIYQNGTINFADFKSQKGLKLTDDKQGSRDVDFFQPDGKYASYLPIIKD
jgi:hypothetical protein